MAPGNGPRSTELKVRGAIDGFIEIKPTKSSDGPSYAGTYSERVVGWLTDPDTDRFRVVNFRLQGRLAGSDGTSVVFKITIKVTMKPDGTAVVERQSGILRMTHAGSGPGLAPGPDPAPRRRWVPSTDDGTVGSAVRRGRPPESAGWPAGRPLPPRGPGRPARRS